MDPAPSTPRGPADQPYPAVSSRPDLPALEQRLLDRWEEQKTFERSVEQRPSDDEFVFYDGPPFANGLPHYGHLLTGYVKDVVPRYQTMRGKRVERRFGWDCHGLPAEMMVEQESGVAGRAAITAYGIDRFNDLCRTSVLRYTDEWERYVTRQARWVDFADDYKTMDLPYMESVIWAFKQLWDKGLVYEAYRVMPYSWGAETPLSNFEIRLDDATRPRQDPALTVAFTVAADGRTGRVAELLGDGPAEIWAWTTTPWTLPSNLALATGPDIGYSVVEVRSGRRAGTRVLIGSGALERYAKDLGEDHEILGTLTGAELAGLAYEPLLGYFAGRDNCFVVLSGDFVTDDDGTGIVHMAPGFGEDDQRVCEANGIVLVCPVDDSGRFTAEVPDYEGQNVFDANPNVIADLKAAGVVVRHDTYEHNYPHCWRTDTPIIYKAVSSWYVEVTAFRDRLVELNQDINWIPSHVRDGQFGKWLEGARDWSISRNRFWGSPIPVWRSDDPAYPRLDVYGSLEEIEADFGVRLDDLHRPTVDELVRPNPDDPTGRSTMRRVPEVLDCWFESGSMPWAQVHYPFENKEWFEHHFPADFIVEYIAQTRGWFYTLMVLATALFDKPPFKNVICHGVVLDADGEKLSKRKQNYPSPDQVFDTHGADALRWYLVSSPILRGNNLAIDEQGKVFGEVIRQSILPLWNAYAFFCLYANADGVTAKSRADSQQLLDRYILGKTRVLVESVTRAMDVYDLPAACQEISSFTDALNNWYIRRSRERFWRAEKDQDKQDAYDTLFAVLTTVLKVAAPFLPLIAEEIYRGLTGETSVHLADWPDVSRFPKDDALVADMDLARDVCSSALALRKAKDLRVRQPLKTLTVAGTGTERLTPYFDLVRDEVNVKEVRRADKVEDLGTFVLQVNAKLLGPKLGKDVQRVIVASKSGDWKSIDATTVEVAGVKLTGDEFALRLQPKAGLAAEALPGNKGLVALDTDVTPELEREGIARDVVRSIQQARKDAKLDVSDRVKVSLVAPERVVAAVREHEPFVKAQTLCVELRYEREATGEFVSKADLDGDAVAIGITRV